MIRSEAKSEGGRKQVMNGMRNRGSDDRRKGYLAAEYVIMRVDVQGMGGLVGGEVGRWGRLGCYANGWRG